MAAPVKAPRPRAAIVASGSELVRGDRNDRNGPFLAAALLRLGIEPVRITVVGDDPSELETALREGLEHDLLCVSGGLGPTHDDRTIELLAKAAGVGLAVDHELESQIEAISRGFAERMRRPYVDFASGVTKQATLPVGAVHVGVVGTAPGVVLDAGSCVAVALPGPPRELQEMWPRVVATEPFQDVLARAARAERRVIRFFGLSESALAQALAEAGGDGDGVTVTICAREFELIAELFVEAGAEARADELEAALAGAGPQFVFSRDGGVDPGARARAAALARLDARDRRVLHRRPGRCAADRRGGRERRLRRLGRRLRERGEGGIARRSRRDARDVRSGVRRDGRCDGSGCAVAARRGRRGRRDRRRGPGWRDAGEAGRARVPACCRARWASVRRSSSFPATGRRSGRVRPSLRCT